MGDPTMSRFLARIGWLGRLVLAVMLATVILVAVDAIAHTHANSSFLAGAGVAFVTVIVLGQLAQRAPRCPHCRELVKHADARACSHCGHDLRVMPVTEASARS